MAIKPMKALWERVFEAGRNTVKPIIAESGGPA
jgi:hypothetical protein